MRDSIFAIALVAGLLCACAGEVTPPAPYEPPHGVEWKLESLEECELVEGRLSVGLPGTTRMACPAEVMEQETYYLGRLSAASGLALVGEQLEGQCDDSTAPLRFRRAQPAHY